jgi:hypothetical protein
VSAVALQAGSRRSYQRQVAALLDEIERRRLQLMTLRAGGATRDGLAGLKAELRAVRDELAATIASR